jgi:hypothetical protein
MTSDPFRDLLLIDIRPSVRRLPTSRSASGASNTAAEGAVRADLPGSARPQALASTPMESYCRRTGNRRPGGAQKHRPGAEEASFGAMLSLEATGSPTPPGDRACRSSGAHGPGGDRSGLVDRKARWSAIGRAARLRAAFLSVGTEAAEDAPQKGLWRVPFRLHRSYGFGASPWGVSAPPGALIFARRT